MNYLKIKDDYFLWIGVVGVRKFFRELSVAVR